MIQSWHRVTRQKVTLSFAHVNKITFPSLSANKGAEGPLVIEAEIEGHAIHRMYVDGGSSLEVLYEHCFNRLRPEIKSQMVPATTSLTGFSGETIWPLGQLRLLVTIGDAKHFTKAWMNFMIVRLPSPYNGIIRRPGIREIQAVPSTAHGMLKFPVNGGVVTIRSTILTPNECATITETSKDSIEKIEGGPENLKVAINPDFLDQEVALGGTLSIEGKTTLCALLKRNLNKFAWQPSDMTGAPERAKAIQVEVQKLVEAGIMCEVYYHDWLSNPVMVKKHDDSWRMCMDFMNLNKACPHDCYPLSEIDWKVESLCCYPFKCLLDAYKGYHQIQMAELDEEKTAFYTPHRVYCYTKMLFGLKNTRATYQRLVDKAFEKQVGQNLEVYVDDLVIKSHTEAELLRDIEETFRYMVGPEGIKPCPEKIEAVLQLPSPRTIKEVQSLNGKLAGLNRFLSKSAEKSLPLFKTLKKCIKKRLPLDTRSGAGFQTTEIAYIRTPHVSGTKAKGRANNVLVCLSRSGWPCLDDRKGLNPDVGLFFITDQPIKQVMSRPDVAGRLQKWSIMLGEHNITYRPRTSVKGQILADFLVEKPEETLADTSEKEAPQEPWTLFTDDSLCIDGSGAGLIPTSLDGAEFTYALSTDGGTQCTSPEKPQQKADSLSKLASTSFAHLSKQVLVEVLQEKSIQEKEVAAVVEEEGPTWMTPITEYLKDGILPDDKKEVNKLRIKARQYELMDGILYRRSFLRPWLSHAVKILLANHAQGHTRYDTQVQRFPSTQARAKKPSATADSNDIPVAILQMVNRHCGSFSGRTWEGQVLDSRHGLLYKMDRSKGCGNHQSWSSKESNGLVEKANRSLKERIKARLGEGNKNWIEEIPHVLWAHRIMIKSSNRDAPFSLTYGTEDVIPAEIGMLTYRTAVVDVVHNDDEIRLNLDLLEERRERAAIREAKAKSKMTRYYIARVRSVTFKPGDYVYRSNEASHAMDGGKVGPKWEGPYEVTEVLGDGAYKLRSMDGAVLPRTWNIANLKKCYL
ncbi:reverse transcriptase domain-containing protein [Tanacetum coccineum]